MLSGTAFSKDPVITSIPAPALGSRFNGSVAPLNRLVKEPAGLFTDIPLFSFACNLSLNNLLFAPQASNPFLLTWS